MAEPWRNWTGDQRCEPNRVERPRTRAGLADSVNRAVEEGRRIRVAGSGHSFSDIALTDGVQLRLGGLSSILDVDRGAGLVKVEAGIVLGELSRRLDAIGFALENLGDIDRQTLAGAISTGTHGTGARFRNLSAQVEAVEMVTANGRWREVSLADDRTAFRAARVGLGALGVVYALTLRVVPAFTIRRVDRPVPLTEVLAALDELADANDHFEFYVFPHTELALVRESERTCAPPEPRGPALEYLLEVAVENWAVEALALAGRAVPAAIPFLARAVAGNLLGRSVKVDGSHRVFASDRRVRFTEMEYAIPRAGAAGAVRRVLELASGEALDVSFPIEVRFVAPDDALLSPAHERETCYVAVHMYRGMPWEDYFRGVEAIMDEHEGRPHWGKRHFQTAATLAPRYPRWEEFQRVRRRLDPGGTFANACTDRVLGPS